MDAADYDELWNSIAGSPLVAAYVQELHSLASDVVRLAEDVFKAAPRPKTTDDYVRVDHVIMGKLFKLLGDAARISAMLTERSRRRNQKAREYEVHRRRVEWLLNEALKGVRLQRVFDAKVRHTLEHFDEYIDRTAIKYATGQVQTPSVAPIDFVFSRRRALARALQEKPRNIYLMRVYIASERVFINCGHEIGVQTLHDECRRIVRRLNAYVPAPYSKTEDRDSYMIVITPETFQG
jgi:hypothetical protein